MTTIAEPVALFARNACLSSSTRLPAISSERNVPPVKLRPGLKVMFVSGHSLDVIMKDGVHTRSAFLNKPVTPLELAQKVREALDSDTGEAG